MKTLIIAIILGVVAHAAVGALMESKTATSLKNHNAQIELTKGF
ncbi:MAG: hypothetical protein PHE67_11905 [Campylobacterales bacterium]|nr:hypothetical protein [Campylobacterales bacterium]